MANFKGSGILAIGKLFKGKDLEHQQFLGKLTPDELKAYKNALPVSWIPADMAASISAKAAQVLFPGDPFRLVRLGHDRALVHINGMYKLIFHIMNITTVLEHAAELWPTQHDTGKAWVEKGNTNKSAALCVSDYPTLPEPYIKLVEGFVHGVLEAAGAKNIHIVNNTRNPNLWRWEAIWG